MNKAEWASFRAALKTLDAGPRRIAQAREEYNQADAWMKDSAHNRNFSQAGQEHYYATAKAKRDTAIKAEVDKIGKALEVARELRNFPNEKIDLSDAKLQAALNIVNLMGGKLPHAQQISIIQDFQGKPAELNFLADVFDSQKLYYGNYARELAKPISEEALNNLDYCCGAYEMLGKWPFEEKCYWTQNAFAEAASRFGFDVADGKDAYVEALKSARAGQTPEAQRILSSAIAQIQNGREYLTDAQKAEIFNDATAKVKAFADDAEAREISIQANTQTALDAIRAASANVTSEGGAD